MAAAFQAIAQVLSLRVVDSLAEGTLICLFATLLFRFAGQKNAGSRFSFWFFTLLAIATVPMIRGGWWSHGGVNVASRSAITLPESFAAYVLCAWAIVSTWHLVAIGRGLWRIHQLRETCILLDDSTLHSLLRETLTRYRAKRSVTLYTSEQVRVPIAIGLMTPAIVFPQWTLEELSPSELSQILVHELEHLRRRDDWTNLVQHLVKAVFFFHPAIWWIERKLTLEREMACDDAVIAETSSPRTYAECLAHLAEKSFLLRSLELAHAALGRIRQVSTRITRILDGNRTAQDPGRWQPAVVLVGVFAIGCAFWSSRAPRLVAFERPAVQVTAAQAESTSALQASDIPKPSTTATARTVSPLRATQPSARTRGSQRGRESLSAAVPAIVARATRVKEAPDTIHVVRETSTDVPIVETYYVFYEGPEGDTEVQQVYQIRMLRLTVFHTFVSRPTHQVSRHET